MNLIKWTKIDKILLKNQWAKLIEIEKTDKFGKMDNHLLDSIQSKASKEQHFATLPQRIQSKP